MGILSDKDKAAIRRGAWCNDTSVPQSISPDSQRLKNTWGRCPGLLGGYVSVAIEQSADTPATHCQNGFVETTNEGNQ